MGPKIFLRRSRWGDGCYPILSSSFLLTSFSLKVPNLRGTAAVVQYWFNTMMFHLLMKSAKECSVEETAISALMTSEVRWETDEEDNFELFFSIQALHAVTSFWCRLFSRWQNLAFARADLRWLYCSSSKPSSGSGSESPPKEC